MKIEGILKQILEEEVQNKKLFKFLLEKWRIQKENLTETEAENLFNRFNEIKTKLNSKLPQVSSFLSRFDGQFGYDKFEEDNLRDITKYTYKQIKSLIDEYTPVNELIAHEDIDVFNKMDNSSDPEKIQSSKDLWFGDRYCIANFGSLRVYDPGDQITSMKFGYYHQNVNQTYFQSVAQWCVTWRKGSNQWSNYRSNKGRTFYFVIDESKHPENIGNKEISKYYISALQVSPQTNTGYVVTSSLNDGEIPFTWNDILKIYPQLSTIKDSLVNKPYTNEELKQKSILGMIYETPGLYQFKRLEKNIKRDYINGGGALSNPESWKSMDNELKGLYVTSIDNRASAINKFGNYEFLSEIKKIGNDVTLLNNRLRAIGLMHGIGDLYDFLMDKIFKVARHSINNNEIVLFMNKNNGNFGIYSHSIKDWMTIKGITYTPHYKRIKQTAIKYENSPYILEIFSMNSSENDSSFYTLKPYTGNESSSSYFFTREGFLNLTEKMDEEDIKGKKVSKLTDFNPESDVDIKEIKTPS